MMCKFILIGSVFEVILGEMDAFYLGNHVECSVLKVARMSPTPYSHSKELYLMRNLSALFYSFFLLKF